ncbi:MAG: biotin-dependent carboxyltransferase family protein [Pseudomonadota bacterium]
MSAHVEVLAPGAMTTVQDLGRFGAQALGVPVSGALDRDALRLANALVGNAAGMACLEIRLFGPTLRVKAESARIALTGTETVIELLGQDSRMIAAGQSTTLKRDQEFRVGALRDTATAYLAVAGGFDLPEFLGSQSTYTPGGFGGLDGRPLAQGDALPLSLATAPAERDLKAPAGLEHQIQSSVRIVLGPQDDYFSENGRNTFLSTLYRVSDQMSRMGIRLLGEEVEHLAGHDIPSDGVVTGAIQVPGNGLPIILLADRQTTGGYPKIATVISADLPSLARLRPGDEIRFQTVTVAEAEAARRESEFQLKRMIDQLAPVGAVRIDPAMLMQVNLISGVVSAAD